MMKTLWIILLSFTVLLPNAHGAATDAGLIKAQKDAESKGFRFEGKRDAIVAKAQKEGGLRGLLGFDKPTIVALRDGFRKKYPFINANFEEHGNPAESQRFLMELQSGRVADWDINNILNEAQREFAPYIERFDLRAMAEQGVLQIPPKMVNPESRNVVALSSTIDASAYNKKLLPADLVPKSWEDFLKPEHSGRKLLVDIRPNSVAGLITAMGFEWVESYARKLAAQQPIWVRGHTRYLNAMAAGEYRLFFGTYYHGVMRMKKRGAQDLEVLLTEPVPVRLTEPHVIAKGARRPYAAMLFLEYVASSEGQSIMWDVEPFKSSFYAHGSKTEELVRGKKFSLGDWDHGMKQQVYMEKLTAAFGFPREDKK